MKCPNCDCYLFEFDAGTNNYRHECIKCGFHVFPNRKKIKEIYTWLSVDSKGQEGMIACNVNGVMMIAQHSEREMALKMAPSMLEICRSTGVKMRLVRYIFDSVLSVVEEIK